MQNTTRTTDTGEGQGEQEPRQTAAVAVADREWWKESVVYQIYPRSFNDSNGDGIGDIPGIVEKLDYIDELGVDVVWLNPVYDSPNADNGYDVRDYRAIMPEFGTMADWEELLDGLHDRGIRLIMDLAVNHSSDEHEWFQRSRDPDSPYHDYYFWRDGDPEEPPNDWESFFGGPAWTYDEEVGKWYLHLFDEKQPDLNWDNPAVREEVYDMVEWWLEKGIDGFRMDVINLLSKPPGLPDGEDDTAMVHGIDQFVDGPNLHDYLDELFAVLEGYDVMTVGEMVDLSLEEAEEYVGPDGPMSMAFNFEHMQLDHGPEGRWDRKEWSLTELRETFTRWQNGLHGQGWNSLYMGNHDQPRMVSRFGDDGDYRAASAKMLATLLYTLEGTPYLYQGDEIGMTNYPFESLDEVEDVDTIRNIEVALEEGRLAESEVMELVRHRSRDNARTPMQWDDSEHGGFTDGDPWLAVNPNHERINVRAARADPDSVYHYYRELIELRHRDDLLVYGEYDLLTPDHDCLWAYTRTLGGERATVFLNFDGEPLDVDPGDFGVSLADSSLLVANHDVDGTDPGDGFTLRPYGARVYRT